MRVSRQVKFTKEQAQLKILVQSVARRFLTYFGIVIRVSVRAQSLWGSGASEFRLWGFGIRRWFWVPGSGFRVLLEVGAGGGGEIRCV